MFTVNELSKRGGIAPHVVRYYSRIGLLEPARHPGNGYKLFSRDDVARLRFIRQAQSLGYTLEEIRRFLELRRAGRSPCREVRAILERRIEENRRRIVDLIALQRRMERARRQWERLSDQPDDCDGWCHLIESAASDA
jgi:DNA-binding transcriptional MerR regulator